MSTTLIEDSFEPRDEMLSCAFRAVVGFMQNYLHDPLLSTLYWINILWRAHVF